MLYLKAQINEQVELKIDLYDDEIFTTCPGCGKEVQVEPQDLVEIIQSGGDFVGTNIYCNGCFSKKDDLKHEKTP